MLLYMVFVPWMLFMRSREACVGFVMFVFHELVKISWEKLGFWFGYVLINYMRLCCKVLKRKVVFEPLGGREMRCMVLFWKIRWKIFWGLWKYFLSVLGSVLGSKWFKTIVTCGVALYFENMFENDYRTVKARNKTCAWIWFWFWKWKSNNLHSKQPTCFRRCIACLWKWFVFVPWKSVGN